MIRFTFAACAIGLLNSAPVSADVTAQDVWTAWQALAEAGDATLSVDRVEPTDTGLKLHNLNLDDLVFPGFTGQSVVGEVTLTEQDGEVIIQWPPSVPFQTRPIAPDAVGLTGSGEITQSDGTITAFGTSEQIDYRFDIAGGAIRFSGAGGDEAGATRLVLAMQISGLLGEASNWLKNSASDASAVLSATSLDWSSDMATAQGQATGGGRVEDVALDLYFTPGEANDIGMSIVGTGKSARSAQAYDMRSDQGALSYRLDTGPTQLEIGFDNQTLNFIAQQQDAEVALKIDGLPIPQLNFSVGTLDALLEIPGDLAMMPAPFHALLSMDAVDLSPILAQIDPNGHIDRTPGELLFDLSGTTTDTRPDDPADRPGPRFKFHAADLEDLRLGLGGAVLSGYGAFVENTDPVPGQPAPQGTLHLALDKGRALLLSLVQAGLIPQQQLNAVQMMLSMFAQPDGDGDRLTSTLEFGPSTRMVINGTQVR